MTGARISHSLLTHLRGRGRIDGLTLESLARVLNRPHLAGDAHLNVLRADFAMGHINELSVTGLLRNVSIAEMLEPLAEGTAAGTLAMRCAFASHRRRPHRLRRHRDQCPAAGGPTGHDRPQPPARRGETGAGFEWPSWLPQALLPNKIEYVEFGVRLLVRDNQLRILGTHGDGDKTILTLKVMGPHVWFGHTARERDRPDPLDRAGPRPARAYDPAQMRDWLDRHKATQP